MRLVLGLINTGIRLVLLLLIAYICSTAYVGFRVGRAIYTAKSTNVVAAIGSSIAGRDNTEKFALERANLPAYVTESPAFWWGLRLSE
jgi:hypothetical protein